MNGIIHDLIEKFLLTGGEGTEAELRHMLNAIPTPGVVSPEQLGDAFKRAMNNYKTYKSAVDPNKMEKSVEKLEQILYVGETGLNPSLRVKFENDPV